jgi:hypothetical protein
MATVERLRITREADGITARIKPGKSWSVLCSLSFGLASWIAGLIVALNLLAKDVENNSSVVPLFLIFWGAAAAVQILALLWNLFGEEVISIRDGLFTRKLALGGIGIKKTFPATELFNLRPSGFFDERSRGVDDRGLRHLGLSDRTVAVDTKYETLYRFGIRLEKSESMALAQALEPYLPSARYLVSVPLPDMNRMTERK